MNNGWQKIRLGDCVTLSKERFDPRVEHEIRCCIELEHIESATGRLLGDVASNETNSTKTVFVPGDVLFGKLRPYLKKYAVPKFYGVCCSEIWVIKPKDNVITTDFLYALVQSEIFMKVANCTSGSRMPRANWHSVSDLILDLPPIYVQNKISEILRTWDELIKNIENVQTLRRKQKRGLIQKLMEIQVTKDVMEE